MGSTAPAPKCRLLFRTALGICGARRSSAARPAGTVLVEPGGTLNASGSYGNIKVIVRIFVRRDGTVDVASRQVTVYAEPGAVVSQSTLQTRGSLRRRKSPLATPGCSSMRQAPRRRMRHSLTSRRASSIIQPRSALPDEIITVRGPAAPHTRWWIDWRRGMRARPQPGFFASSTTPSGASKCRMTGHVEVFSRRRLAVP